MTATIPHDPGLALMSQVPVDASHPGTDLVHQETLAKGKYVVGPLIHRKFTSLNITFIVLNGV